MSFQYQILTRIIFRHTFFPDGRYYGFRLQAEAETLLNMKRLSLVFKQTPDGLILAYETGNGWNRSREDVLREPVTLYFRITNTEEQFLNYTAGLPDQIASCVLYLRNRRNTGTMDTMPGYLHENTEFSVKDILHNRRPEQGDAWDKEFFEKPFGWLEINLYPGLEEELLACFSSKATQWRYILASAYLQDLSDPAVIHKETKKAFKGPIWVQLPDKQRRMAFESTEPIPLSGKPEKSFQLVENFQPETGRYKVVISVLPNPDVRTISRVYSEESEGDATNNHKFSEIFI